MCLDRCPPKISLLALTPVLSIISTLIVNLAAQVGMFFWLLHQPWSVCLVFELPHAGSGG